MPNFPIPLPRDLKKIVRELKLDPRDFEERFVRGGGPGGQKVNKTSSAVQIKHRPTGLEARAQDYREQPVNRRVAWKRIILKLEEREKGKESRLQKILFKLRKQKQRRSRRAKEKMLKDKHLRAAIKELRSDPSLGE